MECPFCDLQDHRRKVHLHLVEDHGSAVHMGMDEGRTRMFYCIGCPQCSFRLERTVKPRGKNPGFLQEFEREIKLVAFDMLLNHIELTHPALRSGKREE
jgi:hypothetical protein